MTKKVVLVSDNHLNINVLKQVYNQHLDADYFLHCGDSEMNPDDIKPFISVRGNNDNSLFTSDLLMNIAGYKLLITHGNKYIRLSSLDNLVYKALECDVDLCCFGHTHIFTYFEVEGIKFINPGSCKKNRDGSLPSYAVIYLNDEGITIERINIEI